jgi:catechol 2,3-dioxygenase-like lactoylglutathione lyase family enzyme
MLNEKNAMATIAVRDAKVARRFYEGVLGLKVDDADPMLYRSGATTLVIYQSEYAGTNQATSATWGVGSDLDAIVADLKAKGVTFEHYDLPDMTREGDIHVMGEFRAAWLRDPDGNFLHINNQ